MDFLNIHQRVSIHIGTIDNFAGFLVLVSVDGRESWHRKFEYTNNELRMHLIIKRVKNALGLDSLRDTVCWEGWCEGVFEG